MANPEMVQKNLNLSEENMSLGWYIIQKDWLKIVFVITKLKGSSHIDKSPSTQTCVKMLVCHVQNHYHLCSISLKD